MNASGRRGFTIVELLVVVVLGTIVLLAAYQVLATNTRVYAINSARVQGQQTLRGAVDLLSGELREISPREGDLIKMGEESLTIRAQRTFGLVCAVDYSVTPTQVSALRVGPVFQERDSVFLLFDNDPNLAFDDVWIGGDVGGVNVNSSCGGMPAQVMDLPFVSSAALAAFPDSVRVGAPIRGFDAFTYGPYEMDGEIFLGRQARGVAEPEFLIGPLKASDGITFRYLDGMGNETAVETLVAQIELTLRYESEMQGFLGEAVSDSVQVRVFPRN